MGWLNIAGGAAEGLTKGLQDIDRYQAEKFARTQRERTLKKQGEEDAYEAEIRGIQRPEGMPDSAYAKELAKVQGRHGRPKESLETTATARALKAREDADAERAKFNEIVAKFKPFHEKAQKDPFGVLDDGADDYNANVPDGHTAYKARTPNGAKFTIVNDKTGKVLQTYDVTNDDAREKAAMVVQGMMLRELGVISPEMYLKSFEKGLDLTKLGFEGKKLGLEARKVATDEKRATTADNVAQSTIGLNEAHAKLYGAQLNRFNQLAKAEANPFKVTQVRRGKEAVPVFYRTTAGPNGVPQPEAYTMDGQRITDPATIKSLFAQREENPFYASLRAAAEKSGDIAQVETAEKVIAEHKAKAAVEEAKRLWAATPPEGRDAAYKELLEQGVPPQVVKEITGGHKPKKAAGAAAAATAAPADSPAFKAGRAISKVVGAADAPGKALRGIVRGAMTDVFEGTDNFVEGLTR